MEVTTGREGDIAHVRIVGRIDETGAEEMKKRFNELPLQSIKEVHFDFNKVSHIGSAGLGKMLLFYKSAKKHGGAIRISGVSQPIYDLLMELELHQLFHISR
ncbi:MAG: STAS domain-containing protein [Desulfobacterales bacterium]|nr:STAS domain-containing protein [Desulfobacterales bacterium]